MEFGFEPLEKTYLKIIRHDRIFITNRNFKKNYDHNNKYLVKHLKF